LNSAIRSSFDIANIRRISGTVIGTGKRSILTGAEDELQPCFVLHLELVDNSVSFILAHLPFHYLLV
jgi:hypothetical protein